MNDKKLAITKRSIYISAERCFSEKEVSEFLYNLWYQDSYVLCSLSESDVRDIIACMQNALNVNGKGEEE